MVHVQLFLGCCNNRRATTHKSLKSQNNTQTLKSQWTWIPVASSKYASSLLFTLGQWPSACGSTAPFEVDPPFHRGCLRPWKTQIFTLQFMTVIKLQLWSSNQSNFVIGCHHGMRNSIKVSQHWEGGAEAPDSLNQQGGGGRNKCHTPQVYNCFSREDISLYTS